MYWNLNFEQNFQFYENEFDSIATEHVSWVNFIWKVNTMTWC